MPSETAKIDDNYRKALLAVTDDANAYIKNLLVDPATGRLKVTAILSSGSVITSLNGLTANTQTFSDVDDTNVTLTISSVTSTHTFTVGWSGQLAVARGGTGGATALAGFNNLSPLTTAGDILTHNGTNNIRLGIGSANQYLRVNAGATALEWATLSSAPTDFSDSVFCLYDNA